MADDLIVPFDVTQKEEVVTSDNLIVPFNVGEQKTKLKSELAAENLSFMQRANQFSQGMSNRILRGGTIGLSALLPGIPEETQQNIAAFDEKHPYLGTAAEIVPAALQGYGIAKGATYVAPKTMAYVSSKIPSWVQLAGLGVTEGSIYSAATADEGERVKSGAIGGGIGAVAGPTGGILFKSAGKVFNAFGSGLKRILANTPHAQAIRVIKNAVEAEDLSPEFIRAELARLGPEGRLVDVSESLARTARGAAAMDARSHGIADSFLKDRQSGQSRRLVEAVGGDNFDADEFSRSFSKWLNSRITKAGPAYEEAYMQSLQLTPMMEALMKRPSIQSAMKRASSIIVEEGGGGGHVRYFDAVKRELDDKIGVALRKGQKETARRLINTKNQLLQELDSQVPKYAEARSIFASEAQLKSAAEMGYETITRNKDLWVIEESIKAMGESEQHAFRLGALRGIVDRLDKAPTNRNAAEKLIESNRAQQLLKLVFPDDESFQRFVSIAEAESTFSRTKNTVLGGSPTARITEDVKGIEEGLSVGSSLMSSTDPIGIAAKFMKMLGIGKPHPDTLEIVSKILFSRNVPPKDMANILQRVSRPDRVARTAASAASGVAGSQPVINELEQQ